jgi:hypothetical protein
MPGPGFLYNTTNTTQCPHAGKVTNAPSGPRVFVTGVDPVATAADLFTIAGCPFATPAGPHPCVTVTWLTPALRLTSMGRPLLLNTSAGLTLAPDLAPQGAPLITVNQQRVTGM